jgi:hypothetical protein
MEESLTFCPLTDGATAENAAASRLWVFSQRDGIGGLAGQKSVSV